MTEGECLIGQKYVSEAMCGSENMTEKGCLQKRKYAKEAVCVGEKGLIQYGFAAICRGAGG